MRRYETIFILRPDLGDLQIKETIKRYEGIIAAGAGEMMETEEWGARELAYRSRASGAASTCDWTTFRPAP